MMHIKPASNQQFSEKKFLLKNFCLLFNKFGLQCNKRYKTRYLQWSAFQLLFLCIVVFETKWLLNLISPWIKSLDRFPSYANCRIKMSSLIKRLIVSLRQALRHLRYTTEYVRTNSHEICRKHSNSNRIYAHKLHIRNKQQYYPPACIRTWNLPAVWQLQGVARENLPVIIFERHDISEHYSNWVQWDIELLWSIQDFNSFIWNKVIFI